VTGLELLDEQVSRFNAGVASGDWEPMLALFEEDAELAFEGVPVGPFRGRGAIAQAYREQPPDDTIELLDARERDGVLVASYSWSRDAGARSGELRLTPSGEKIARLVVTFG
jgi:steroid Delta-isomerase